MAGNTDNSGNTFVTSRLMTSKFPMVGVLMELAEQVRRREVVLNLEWAPREQNTEADALTNNETSGFDPRRRIEVKLEELERAILPGAMAIADEIYEKARETRRTKPERNDLLPRQKTALADRLRVRDPWD